jgi:hypothetical protein
VLHLDVANMPWYHALLPFDHFVHDSAVVWIGFTPPLLQTL